MTTEPRTLPHVGNDEAFAARLNDATQAMHRLPARNDNARLVAAIQCASLYFLFGATDTANRQAENTNDRRNNCTAACGFSGCNRQRPQRAGDTRLGEKQDAGNPAAGSKEKVGHE